MAKIQIKTESITGLEGIFLIMEQLKALLSGMYNILNSKFTE